MLTATKQWFTLPVLISCYCFVCTQANSGSVYSLANFPQKLKRRVIYESFRLKLTGILWIIGVKKAN